MEDSIHMQQYGLFLALTKLGLGDKAVKYYEYDKSNKSYKDRIRMYDI